MSSAPLLQNRRHDRRVIDHPQINRFAHEPFERIITMLRKFAGALLAATLLTAPAFAEDMSKNPAPAAVATQPANSNVKAAAKPSVTPEVKANVKAKTNKGKHVRRHVRTHIAKHGKAVKAAKHGKGLKVAKHGKGLKVSNHSKGVKSVKITKTLKQTKRATASKRINTNGAQGSTKTMTKTGSN
jgi:hypothetical protein